MAGSSKSSSGPSESSASMSEESGSSLSEESSFFSSMSEPVGSSSAIEESSSGGSGPYGESSSAGSSESSGSSGYCSFDVYDINVAASNVGVFSVYNSGTVDLTLELLTLYVEYWDYAPYFPIVLAPGEWVAITVTLPSDRTIWGAAVALDTSCGPATFNFPS